MSQFTFIFYVAISVQLPLDTIATETFGYGVDFLGKSGTHELPNFVYLLPGASGKTDLSHTYAMVNPSVSFLVAITKDFPIDQYKIELNRLSELNNADFNAVLSTYLDDFLIEMVDDCRNPSPSLLPLQFSLVSYVMRLRADLYEDVTPRSDKIDEYKFLVMVEKCFENKQGDGDNKIPWKEKIKKFFSESVRNKVVGSRNFLVSQLFGGGNRKTITKLTEFKLFRCLAFFCHLRGRRTAKRPDDCTTATNLNSPLYKIYVDGLPASYFVDSDLLQPESAPRRNGVVLNGRSAIHSLKKRHSMFTSGAESHSREFSLKRRNSFHEIVTNPSNDGSTIQALPSPEPRPSLYQELSMMPGGLIEYYSRKKK